MGILTDTIKADTGSQIKSWIDSANQSINNIRSCKDSIQKQIAAMGSNPDYNQSDIAEVQSALNALNTEIAGL